MKTNGATWKAYLASWPEGQWFDDSDETFDGKTPEDNYPADDAVVQFSCGVVFKDDKDHEGVSLVSHFRKWERSLTNSIVMVEVPKAKLDELEALNKGIGGRLLKN